MQLPASWKSIRSTTCCRGLLPDVFQLPAVLLDTVTSLLAGLERQRRGPDLDHPRVASLLYRGHYVNQVAGPHSEIEYAAQATALDPDLPSTCCITAGFSSIEGSRRISRSRRALAALSGRSARILEILDLARQLPAALQATGMTSCARRQPASGCRQRCGRIFLNLGCSPSSRNRRGWILVNDGVLRACALEAT